MPRENEPLQYHFTDGLSLQEKNENEKWSLLDCRTELVHHKLKGLPINNPKERNKDNKRFDMQC